MGFRGLLPRVFIRSFSGAAFWGGSARVASPWRENSIGEHLSALCASSLENLSSVSGLHSLAETVLHLSLAFLRLVSSEHSFDTSLRLFTGLRTEAFLGKFPRSAGIYKMTPNIIHNKIGVCQVFFEKIFLCSEKIYEKGS